MIAVKKPETEHRMNAYIGNRKATGEQLLQSDDLILSSAIQDKTIASCELRLNPL